MVHRQRSLESASGDILASVGKPKLTSMLAFERLHWMKDLDLEVGISLMFGAISTGGVLLETEATVDATVKLAETIVDADIPVAGFYPNVMTVLPGTALSHGLAAAGIALDFYRMPRSELLDGFEDGAVGYNFTTIPDVGGSVSRQLARRVVEAGQAVQQLGARVW